MSKDTAAAAGPCLLPAKERGLSITLPAAVGLSEQDTARSAPALRPKPALQGRSRPVREAEPGPGALEGHRPHGPAPARRCRTRTRPPHTAGPQHPRPLAAAAGGHRAPPAHWGAAAEAPGAPPGGKAAAPARLGSTSAGRPGRGVGGDGGARPGGSVRSAGMFLTVAACECGGERRDWAGLGWCEGRLRLTAPESCGRSACAARSALRRLPPGGAAALRRARPRLGPSASPPALGTWSRRPPDGWASVLVWQGGFCGRGRAASPCRRSRWGLWAVLLVGFPVAGSEVGNSGEADPGKLRSEAMRVRRLSGKAGRCWRELEWRLGTV